MLAFAWKADPRWPLVMAGNRDELHARPAAPLARWDDPRHLVAGRDLLSGGTWLGVSELGRFAVITNLRGFGPPETDRESRGALVTGLLSGEGPHADPEKSDLSAFNPFNLILVDGERAWFLSNRPGDTRSLLAPGIYGLSNGGLDDPWPKTMRLKARLLDWLGRDGAAPGALLDDLRDERLPEVGVHQAPPSEIPEEPALSPIFMRHPVYGTRCSSVVALDDQGRGHFIERRFDAGGAATGETSLSFSWPR